jgi:hypothetical protein
MSCLRPFPSSPGSRFIFLAILGWLPAICATAREFHVAPDGDDSKSGSKSTPFATVQRAEKDTEPGDTVLIHGGTYKMSSGQIANNRRGKAYVTFLSKSGLSGKPISYVAFGDEKPVFDFSEVKPPGSRVTAFHVTGSWLHLKGLAVTGVQVTITGHTQSICFDNEGDHNIYEQLQMHDGQAIGFWLGKGSENLVLNCDAWRNHDHTSENKKGGNVDGFGFHVPPGSTGNVFRGCRAWLNSDDGFDLISTREPVIIENCWSFYNGFDPSFGSLGDGNGFKLGGYGVGGGVLPAVIPRHVIRGSLAVRNRASGFYANHQPGGIDIFNNTAFLNGVNFNLLGRNAEHTADVPGYGHVLKNNLGYKARGSEISNFDAPKCELVANSFDLKLKLDDRDFKSLDQAELIQPRQANGDLPDIPFMKLKPGNPGIDKGVDVGLPFKGKAPDLGAFESGTEK